ncbi:uncharacterized protein LOC143447279 [Clavelina lepadiformis]|uniref:uncharacterized protein LOC143447279 n=1 Tax=Clavelina lepadiformis TaxID=159417 RepID=UPI0040417D32
MSNNTISSKNEVARLREAHQQATGEVKKQIDHWEGIKSDYENLAKRIATLPDKVSHDVMVPLGKFAFMPGKLIHTNEVMVHLGDSWFAEVSCKQGLKIVDHRLESVHKNLDDLDKVMTNLNKKTEFAEELDNNNGEDKAIEIKENIPEDYLHPSRRKRISRVKMQPPTSNKSDASEVPLPTDNQPDVREEHQPTYLNNEDLMRRLDELERLEEEEDEMLLQGTLDENSTHDNFDKSSHEKPVNEGQSEKVLKTPPSNAKKVSWSGKLTEGREANSDDSDECEPVIIKFKHSSANIQKNTINEKLKSASVQSPADIGQHRVTFRPDGKNNHQVSEDINPTHLEDIGSTVKEKNIPKSILKPTNSPFDRTAALSNPLADQLPRQTAVSERVLEHKNVDAASSPKEELPKKRVSLFKASRRK